MLSGEFCALLTSCEPQECDLDLKHCELSAEVINALKCPADKLFKEKCIIAPNWQVQFAVSSDQVAQGFIWLSLENFKRLHFMGK